MAQVSDQKFYIALNLLVALTMSSAAAKAQGYSEITYPEERSRSAWDKGCKDWVPEAPYIAGISVDTERKGGVFRIKAAAILDLLPGQGIDRAQIIASELLANGLDYPGWVMPGINQDPEGNPYFVSIDSATASNYRSTFEYAIRGMFSLSVLWFKRVGHTSIIFKHESTALPACKDVFDLSNVQVATKVTYRMIPRPGVLDYMIGEAYISRTPQRVDLKLRAVIKPANVLYQVIPEKLIKTQVDQRARKIFENFVKRHRELSAN